MTPIAATITSRKAPLAAAFAVGLLFSAGLVLSGMTKPEKVTGFLDVLGLWDPSLALVMGAAVAVYAVSMRLVTRRKSPLLEAKFHLPTRRDLDARLLVGSAIFGAGWGLAGVCPGPGLVAAASGALPALVFVGFMLAGMELFRIFDALTRKE